MVGIRALVAGSIVSTVVGIKFEREKTKSQSVGYSTGLAVQPNSPFTQNTYVGFWDTNSQKVQYAAIEPRNGPVGTWADEHEVYVRWKGDAKDGTIKWDDTKQQWHVQWDVLEGRDKKGMDLDNGALKTITDIAGMAAEFRAASTAHGFRVMD